MKKIILCVFILVNSLTAAFSQNYLPLVWKISFTDTLRQPMQEFEISRWQNVCLLLSWERQGYFEMKGDCCLATDFSVPPSSSTNEFVLSLSLQCYVKDIYINGIRIGGKLPNLFWSKRGEKTVLPVPKGCLLFGKKNRIEVYAKALSYTGGLSHNSCTLSPVDSKVSSQVKIEVPSADHNLSINERNAFVRIAYHAKQKGTLLFCVKNDFHDTLSVQKIVVDPKDSLIRVPLKDFVARPGFYEMTAELNDGGFVGDAQWIAVSPEKIACITDTVPGFKSFWENTLSDLSKVAPAFKVHKVDSLCSANRDGYVMEMKSLGELTIRGYYFVPKAKGKYPAVLHVPGYGYGFQYLDGFLKNKDQVVELALCVRGHGISRDVFNPGFGVPGIWGYELCNKKEFAYRGIYMDCVRAVEFLLSREEVDGSRIGVMGGSQGGGLTLATAGLCKSKIRACAYFDPFLCDLDDFLNIRTMCQSELSSYLTYYHNTCKREEAMYIQGLIDTKGFAHWITCPAFFATSLFDDDCPPHVGFAAYNMLKTPKKFKIYPNDSHLGESDNAKDMMAFLKEQLGF